LKLSALSPYFFASRYYSHLYPLTLDIYDNEPLPGDFIETDDADEEAERIAVLPPTLPLTRASLADTGVYLHDSGDQLTILVQPHAP
jgi:hypothetical protein